MKPTGLFCFLIIGLISLTHSQSIQIGHLPPLELSQSVPNVVGNAVGYISQFVDTSYWYRLTTKWQGDGKSLDIINDGKNNQIKLADTADDSIGQYWAVAHWPGPPWLYRRYKIINAFTGTKCLTVINDGKGNNQL